MPPESLDEPHDLAVQQLESLGLSSYAARTFVALVSLGNGTARDISDVSDVPRTRVYDAIDEIQSHGLVDVQQTTPKRFWAVSPETTGRHFEQDYQHRVNLMLEALGALESTARSEEQRGVWTVTGRETVTERVIDFIESASEEIVYMSVAALLTEEVIDSLRAASERGVSIKFATMEQGTEDEIRDEIPRAEFFKSLWEWRDDPAGRLLMVDQQKTLVSVLVTGNGERPPEVLDETAIWGTGETNSLVVVLRALFTWQLGGTRDGIGRNIDSPE